MEALQPVGLSGGLVKVEMPGCLPASGQFSVGRLFALQEHWLVGSLSIVVGDILHPSGSCKISFSPFTTFWAINIFPSPVRI